jgi:hypothetical protein
LLLPESASIGEVWLQVGVTAGTLERGELRSVQARSRLGLDSRRPV